MTKGVHRVTPTSEQGRRFISTGKLWSGYSEKDAELKAWNEAVDRKKAEKAANKYGRKVNHV